MYMDKGEWNEMRVLLFCQDEGWMRYVEKGFRMCRENLEPLEIDGRKTEEEFFDSLWMKQYDIIVMHGVSRMRASWALFFSLWNKHGGRRRGERKSICGGSGEQPLLWKSGKFIIFSPEKRRSAYIRPVQATGFPPV